MKYQGVESSIDPVKERQAIEKFLDKYWDVKILKGTSLSNMIDYILHEGIKRGIALREETIPDEIEWYNLYIKQFNEARKETVAKPMEFTATYSGDSITWPVNFEGHTEELKEFVEKEYQITAQPKGYAQFLEEEDEEYQDEQLEFKGTPLHTPLSATCLDFQVAMSKRDVKYDDEEQGREPLIKMLGCILRQGMNLGILCVEEKYNVKKKLEELRKILCH